MGLTYYVFFRETALTYYEDVLHVVRLVPNLDRLGREAPDVRGSARYVIVSCCHGKKTWHVDKNGRFTATTSSSEGWGQSGAYQACRVRSDSIFANHSLKKHEKKTPLLSCQLHCRKKGGCFPTGATERGHHCDGYDTPARQRPVKPPTIKQRPAAEKQGRASVVCQEGRKLDSQTMLQALSIRASCFG